MKRFFISLAVIAAIAAVLFGASFALEGVYDRRAREEHIWLMETLLPGGRDFTLVPCDGEDGIIKSVHKSSAGYVIETEAVGYADSITVLVGVDLSGAVTGLVVSEAHETLGLGSRILTDHKFLSRFLDKSGTFSIGTSEGDAFSGATSDAESTGDEIFVDGISGATVSSKAVAKCVSAATAYVTGADIESSATEWGD